MLAAKSPRLGTLPTCKRLWTQSGSSSMTGVVIFMSYVILSVQHSGKIFAFAMSSTVQPWRGKTSMFTQGFVPATSPWIGTSSALSSGEGMGPAGTTLFLTKSAIFVDRFVPTQQYLALPFASGIQHTPFIFGISASTSACSFVLPLHRHLYMYLCTTPNTTLTHAYRCVGLCVRVHVLCMCTSPQEHLFCIVYSVFRRPLPCNPTTAHMCISHRRFSNYQIRASRNAHIRLI